MRLGDLDELIQYWLENGEDKFVYDTSAILCSIDEAPVIVVPVVHAKWVGLEYDGYADGCPVYDLWECSNCGEEVSGEDVPDTHPWCHGCGARMDGNG